MTVSQKLIENVKELRTALNEISVYDLDVYTSMELYYKIANKLNEVIKELMRFEGLVSDEVVEQNEKLIYLLGEGLNNEVIKKINQMVQDGTMDSIINHNVFNSLNNKIDENKEELSSQIKDIEKNVTINNWINDLNGEFIAHKGYNALKYDGPTSRCVAPDNTIASIELAGELGFKAIEIDVQKCKDGFIISHEINTKLLDGSLENFIDLTVEQIKERTIIKNYMGGGSNEDLQGVKSNNKVPTLEEALQCCKKYNLYCVLDFAYPNDYVYTNDDIDQIISIIKKVNCAKKLFIYGNGSKKITDILRDTIYCMPTLDTDNIENSLNFIKTKKNYCIYVNEDKFNQYKSFLSDYNLPCIVWTIDNYIKSNELLDNGCISILTNRCMKNPIIKNKNKYKINLKDFSNNGSGTETVTNGVYTISSSSYFGKVYKISPGTLKIGDVVVVKAEGRTTESNATGAYGRININNNKSGYYMVDSTELFRKDNFENKTVTYVVTDETENIYIEYGMSGGGYSGNGTCELKNISVEVYTNNMYDKCYGFLYCYRNGFKLRNNFKTQGIKSIYKKTDDSSVLCIEHENVSLNGKLPVVICSMDSYSTQYNYRVVSFNDANVNNVVQIKFLDGTGNFVSDVDTLELGFTVLIM